MRTLADIFGLLIGARSAIHEIEAPRSIIGIVIWGLGILVTFGGCLISAAVQGGGLVFCLGLGMTVAGWLISYSANNKTYPECTERVKYEALKCPHCGHEFVAAPQSSMSEPFYNQNPLMAQERDGFVTGAELGKEYRR